MDQGVAKLQRSVRVPEPSLEGGLMGFQTFPQMLVFTSNNQKTENYRYESTIYYYPSPRILNLMMAIFKKTWNLLKYIFKLFKT
jgi:hypothetical protein